eukprot:11195165-Lingulodinium_polyedra.AAC.1
MAFRTTTLSPRAFARKHGYGKSRVQTDARATSSPRVLRKTQTRTLNHRAMSGAFSKSMSTRLQTNLRGLLPN